MLGVFDCTRYFIVDMDGTFYLDGTIIPGADAFLQHVQAKGREYFFFTNNSANNAVSCMARLEAMGFPVSEQQLMLSSQVAIAYIQANYPGKTVFLLGNERLTADVMHAGIPLVQKSPDIVLLGFDVTLTYQKIWDAAHFIASGALYIATHPDKNCPCEGGFMPDTGSMIELFAASTDRYPLVMGKPTTYTVDYITERLDCKREELAFIGDRLETDIAIGVNHGIPTALVLTGVTDEAAYAHSAIKADVVVPSLSDLKEYIQ